MSKVYDVITDRIIQLIESSNLLPWQKPWESKQSLLGQRNHATGNHYTGVNAFITAMTAMVHGYQSNEWMTFKQAEERGLKVKKGSKATPILYYQMIEKKSKAEEDEDRRIPFARYYSVFNTDQLEGFEPKETPAEEVREPIDIGDLDAILSQLRHLPPINFDGGNRAFYRISTDSIHLPKVDSFKSKEGFYSVLFHEIGHSTGHKDKLNRKSLTEIASFGDHNYSAEELVAEMTAAFLCDHFKIANPIEDHAAYLAGWLKVIKKSPKMLIESASKAYKATEYVLKREG